MVPFSHIYAFFWYFGVIFQGGKCALLAPTFPFRNYSAKQPSHISLKESVVPPLCRKRTSATWHKNSPKKVQKSIQIKYLKEFLNG